MCRASAGRISRPSKYSKSRRASIDAGVAIGDVPEEPLGVGGTPFAASRACPATSGAGPARVIRTDGPEQRNGRVAMLESQLDVGQQDPATRHDRDARRSSVPTAGGPRLVRPRRAAFSIASQPASPLSVRDRRTCHVTDATPAATTATAIASLHDRRVIARTLPFAPTSSTENVDPRVHSLRKFRHVERCIAAVTTRPFGLIENAIRLYRRCVVLTCA